MENLTKRLKELSEEIARNEYFQKVLSEDIQKSGFFISSFLVNELKELKRERKILQYKKDKLICEGF